MSHFQVVYGRDSPPLLQLVEEDSKVEEVNIMIKERNLILDELKENLIKAQERIKRVTDKKIREIEFEVGEYVFLKIQTYHFQSLA